MKKTIVSSVIASAAMFGSIVMTPVVSMADTTQPKGLPDLIRTPAPPSGFNPLTATNSDLAKYGLPTRPTDPAGLKKWENDMKHAKQYVAPNIVVAQGDTFGTISGSWGGYAVQAGNNGGVTYSEAEADIVVPTFQGTVGGSSTPGFWTGVGGITSGDLMQSGFSINSTSSSFATPGTTQYELWTEDVPYDAPAWVSGLKIKPGDDVTVDTYYGPSNGEATAYFDDITTGQYTTVVFACPDFYGDSAEFAVEEPGNSFSNWTTAFFANCFLSWRKTDGSNGAGYFDAYSTTKLNLINTNTGVSEGTTSAINSSNDGFTVTSTPQ